MVCKGLCHKFKAKFASRFHRYSHDQKRCNECELFVSWVGNRCPCCGRILRTKPRISKYRQKYIIKTNEVLK